VSYLNNPYKAFYWHPLRAFSIPKVRYLWKVRPSHFPVSLKLAQGDQY